MIDVLITADEVGEVRSRAVTLDFGELYDKKLMHQGSLDILFPSKVVLKSGYSVMLTKFIFEKLHFETVSISKVSGVVDPADAEFIAKAILGEGYRVAGTAFSKDVFHFIKAHNSKYDKTILAMYRLIRMGF